MTEVLVYSWNTQASFFDERSSHILTDIDTRVTEQVQLIVVALQEAVKPGSQFISLILPNHLATKGFRQLKRSRLMGVGVTTYKALQRFDLRLRGLRLALFLREGPDSLPEVQETYCYCSGLYQWSLGKGALAFTLDLPRGLGRLKLVNLHLPFSASSLNAQEDSVREAAIEVQSQALNDIWSQLVKPDEGCDFTLLIGDFNYRVRLRQGETVDDLDYSDLHAIYEERDELLAEQRKGHPPVLPVLKEGIDNAGPNFPPTAKLLQRTGGEFNYGKQNRRAPSWCDRVLYAPCADLVCLAYERLEPNDATADSDHAAIMARFAITRQEEK